MGEVQSRSLEGQQPTQGAGGVPLAADGPGALAFRPLSLDDLPRLAYWLNRPHVRRFYQLDELRLDQVVSKYLPRIRGEVPVRSHIALHEGKPFGYIQSYRLSDWPAWAEILGAADGVCLELMIGEEDMLKRGLGQAMLRGFIAAVVPVLYPDEQTCRVGHDARNTRGINCSLAVGFAVERHYVDRGLACLLLKRPIRPD